MSVSRMAEILDLMSFAVGDDAENNGGQVDRQAVRELLAELKPLALADRPTYRDVSGLAVYRHSDGKTLLIPLPESLRESGSDCACEDCKADRAAGRPASGWNCLAVSADGSHTWTVHNHPQFLRRCLRDGRLTEAGRRERKPVRA